MATDCKYKILFSLKSKISEKFWDGSYIANRIILDEFTEADMNPKFFFVRDALLRQICCSYADSGKNYKLSAGELTTITMIEELRELDFSHIEITELLLMAYFQELDPILMRWLPTKSMGKIHRHMTNMRKNLMRRNEDLGIPFWRKNHKKYIPLDKSEKSMIEEEIRFWTEEQRIEIFDSENYDLLTDHICYVLRTAFETKIFTLIEFSDEACFEAADIMNSEI